MVHNIYIYRSCAYGIASLLDIEYKKGIQTGYARLLCYYVESFKTESRHDISCPDECGISSQRHGV